jgi:hypothetical protein
MTTVGPGYPLNIIYSLGHTRYFSCDDSLKRMWTTSLIERCAWKLHYSCFIEIFMFMYALFRQ